MRKVVSTARADRLSKIRDLVVLGIRNEITDRTDLTKLAIKRGIFLTEDSKQPYTDSSIYRYYSSILFLGLDNSKELGSYIQWSGSAVNLANVACQNVLSEELSDDEKSIFQLLLFSSGVRDRFLMSFCSTEECLTDREVFSQQGQPIYIQRVLSKEGRSNNKSLKPSKILEVEFTQDPSLGVLHTRDAREFMYTYRLWCLDAGLIDEINIKEAERNGIPREYSFVLYPLRVRLMPTIPEFLEALYNLVKGSERAVVIPIPKLLYTLCVSLKISVEVFKTLLIDTWDMHRDLLRLERGPGILIKGDLTITQRPYSQRYGNHRYYIIKDGTIRSNLVLLPQERETI
jgi:hypothetical protein